MPKITPPKITPPKITPPKITPLKITPTLSSMLTITPRITLMRRRAGSTTACG